MPQWWADSVPAFISLWACFMCVCVCVYVCARVCVRAWATTGHGDGGTNGFHVWRKKNTLEAQEKTFVVYEEHVKPIKSELSSCCSSSCRLQFLVRSPAVSPPGEQICVCAWSLQTHMQWTHMHPQRQKNCTGLTVSSVSATFSWWWRWKMQSYS